jgi:hypothetical protein
VRADEDAVSVVSVLVVREVEVSDDTVVVASVEVPVTPSVVPTATAPDVESVVAVVVARYVVPDTVSAVDEALPSVVCPFAVSAPVKDAVLPKREVVIVRLVVDALARVV